MKDSNESTRKTRVLNTATYFPRSAVDSRQGKDVVYGSEEVGSTSQAGSIANGSQSTPGYGILKCKSKIYLTCPKLNVNPNFLSNVTQKTSKSFQRKYSMPQSKSYLSCNL